MGKENLEINVWANKWKWFPEKKNEINKFIKVKVTKEQATKSQRGSKGIALLFP